MKEGTGLRSVAAARRLILGTQPVTGKLQYLPWRVWPTKNFNSSGTAVAAPLAHLPLHGVLLASPTTFSKFRTHSSVHNSFYAAVQPA